MSSSSSEAYPSEFHQTFDAETMSPTGMQVDGDEYVIDPPENERDGVAIINPDDDDAAEQIAGLPTADDCMSWYPSSIWRPVLNASGRRGYEKHCVATFDRRTRNTGRLCTYLAYRKMDGAAQEGAWPHI